MCIILFLGSMWDEIKEKEEGYLKTNVNSRLMFKNIKKYIIVKRIKITKKIK